MQPSETNSSQPKRGFIMERFMAFMAKFLTAIFSLICIVNVGAANANAQSEFLNFNEPSASQTNWPGWTYSTKNVSYDRPGWHAENYIVATSVRFPRSFRKDDYGNMSLAIIDSSKRAPSTNSGGSLKVYDTGTGTKFQPAWWIWQGDNTIGSKGIATSNHDRLSTYVYLQGINPITNPNVDGYTFEWGTYTCWPGGGYGGGSCPTESNNGHWYHQVTLAPNMWVHILWDKHPSHRRGGSTAPPNNPSMVESGKDYFENHYNSYFQFQKSVGSAGTSAFWIDEMHFTSAAEMGEPAQNDISISSLWVGYQPSDNHWEIGWNDTSNYANHDSKYEIRWSTTPITNANFSKASLVKPLDFAVGEFAIHKSNTYKNMLWTRFNLPQGTETGNSKIYFAVKDISVAGGGYQASPSPLIHTIDYSLRPTTAGGPTPEPAPLVRPANLKIVSQTQQ